MFVSLCYCFHKLTPLRNDHQDHNGTEYTEVGGPHRLILGSLIGATEKKRRICDDQLYLEALSSYCFRLSVVSVLKRNSNGIVLSCYTDKFDKNNSRWYWCHFLQQKKIASSLQDARIGLG